MTRDESKPARTSHGQPVTQYQYARLLDAAARLAGEAERAEAENERLRALLERMDRRGGLGLDVHDWIRAALAGEKAPAEALVGERREPLPCGCVEQCSIDNGLGLPPYPRRCRKRHAAAFVARQKPLPAELMPKDFSKLYDPPAEAPAGEREPCPECGGTVMHRMKCTRNRGTGQFA